MQDTHHLIKSLLPPGRIWESRPSSAFDKCLRALSLELNRGRAWVESIPNVLDENSNKIKKGNLSHTFIEGRLRELGFTDFKISDPTESIGGLEPIIDPEQIGIVFVVYPFDSLHIEMDTTHSI